MDRSKGKMYRMCVGCRKDEKRVAVKFKVCANCRKVAYCSLECQKKNWPEHKAFCIESSKQVKVPSGKKVLKYLMQSKIYHVVNKYLMNIIEKQINFKDYLLSTTYEVSPDNKQISCSSPPRGKLKVALQPAEYYAL